MDAITKIKNVTSHMVLSKAVQFIGHLTVHGNISQLVSMSSNPSFRYTVIYNEFTQIIQILIEGMLLV